MANAHRIDKPIFGETKDGNLELTVNFYAGEKVWGKLFCRLYVFHDEIADCEADDKLVYKNELGHMQPVKDHALIYTGTFEVPRKKTGNISVDLIVVKQNGTELAKASWRLGSPLNEPTKLNRADQAPRFLHGINTAPGPTPAKSTGHLLDDVLLHVHAALTDNDKFRAGIISTTDGLLSNRRQASSDPLIAADEKLSLIIVEKLLALPYQLPVTIYGNCRIPKPGKGKTTINVYNDEFWSRMRPTSEEITYPWCTECQQLTTMVNYLRGVDIWALSSKYAKGELGAQRASFKVPDGAGGRIIEEQELKKHGLGKTQYEHAIPVGPGDFFVFNAEKYTYKQGETVVIVEKATVEGWDEATRKDKQEKHDLKPLPAQHRENHPHISCILRTYKRAGNYFFQLMDTGGNLPGKGGYAILRRRAPTFEGVCDGRFLSTAKADPLAAGTGPCIGVGVFPKQYKSEAPRLEKAHERALHARPVGLARLFIIERESDAVLYATPLLRTYTEDSEQNFSPARLAWSLRNMPHNDKFMAMWGVWVPRGPLAKRVVESRHTSLFDVRSEFAAATTPSSEFKNAILSKFPYREGQGFWFMQNINTISATDAQKIHDDKIKGSPYSFRFPSDDSDPDFYKKFVYVEISRQVSANNQKIIGQLKKYDLDKYPWDQHVFGDRSVREIEKQVTSGALAQPFELTKGDVHIDLDRFALVEGEWYVTGPGPGSGRWKSGKIKQEKGGKNDGQVAKLNDHEVKLTLPEYPAKTAESDKARTFVVLKVPVIDKRYPRPDRFDDYPYFRGDFPMKPDNCPGGNPGPDACADYQPSKCPKDCAYIVKLRGLKLSGDAKLSPAFNSKTSSYTGTVSYLHGGALRVTGSASCKATIKVSLGGKTVQAGSGAEAAPIELAVGDNTVVVEAEADNGSKAKHTLKIERKAASKEHSLDSLKVSPGKLVRADGSAGGFDSTVLEYELVDTQEFKIGVTPKLTNELAQLKVKGKPHSSGTELLVENKGFGAHEIPVEVRAEDGGSSTYQITYYRGDDDNFLKKLQVHADYKLAKTIATDGPQASNPDGEIYEVEIPKTAKTVTITAVPRATKTARVFLDGKQIWGSKKLKVPGAGDAELQGDAPTIVRVEVEAQNGRRRVYELVIERAGS